jgi:S-formylglutathione hydrolase FrmB
MALLELRYFSQALGKMTGAMVLAPEQEDLHGPFPVLYLLHGLSDDYTAWTRKSTIERQVQGLPLIVVMPDGGRGFYTDARQGFAYDTAIAQELVGLIDRTFNTDARRAARAIAGLSMGGYGALRLALTHPDRFCSAVRHSGVLLLCHHHPFLEEHNR